MPAKRTSFAGLTLVLPKHWSDITDSLGEGMPFTLARTDGIGALQFSVAHYKKGQLPNIDAKTLRNFLDGLFEGQGFGRPKNSSDWSISDELAGVQGDHIDGAVQTRAWYVSDGRNIALVTYTTEHRIVWCKRS